MRCALTIAYNGTHFLGSQSQKESKNTILGALDAAFKKLGIETKIVASGRTDRGVHATGQVCHIDVPPYWSNLEKLRLSVNKIVGPSILIKKIKSVDETFHARYGAKKRVYRYIIKNGSSNPFEESFVTFLEDVDFALLQEKIKLFCGTFDFRFFMKNGSDVKSTTRTIYRAFVYRHKGYIILTFEANGFLRSQIRLMVGALFALNSEQIIEQLECKKRYKIKPAPSNGLYLSKIKY
ncbi:MAG: tRNA pseudouridine(38-40) synthase TruA [Sulfurimonas sp.]|uniref:tRNA pseudouridine(38-40) synthase TruA n=1 Tax=Sulfurimonas sp. TaxID=2022749 RepID=UPI00262E74E7|nr:tRNA pseudouridine(38-40) synthase TruA [Sulfurimonas sp.]MDD2652961.1 tRNA pseudouridine(38-40) synthase TruA [Sulfurimonas sp.]MDD3452407.1 tRNA pseudouridine(38-40) synthase TruA [Sulfurimonas sp.]